MQLFFHIYLNDLFYFTEMTNRCNCANDAIFHGSQRLEHDSVIVTEGAKIITGNI